MCPVCLVCFFSIICIKPGCVFYRYTACFFDEKRQTAVKFRYPVFAGLPSLHYGGLTAFAHLLRSGNPAPPRNHSTCSTPSPIRCSDYMTTPIIYCYVCLRPPGKWFWTILHATSSLPARWTPLVERKPDSKESGILECLWL